MNLKEIIDRLRAQRSRLDQAIAALEGSSSFRGSRMARATVGVRHRVMSAAARKRISTAMKARWAARKRGLSARPAKVKAKPAARRRPMSRAARKKLSALMRARWATRKRQSRAAEKTR